MSNVFATGVSMSADRMTVTVTTDSTFRLSNGDPDGNFAYLSYSGNFSATDSIELVGTTIVFHLDSPEEAGIPFSVAYVAGANFYPDELRIQGRSDINENIEDFNLAGTSPAAGGDDDRRRRHSGGVLNI